MVTVHVQRAAQDRCFFIPMCPSSPPWCGGASQSTKDRDFRKNGEAGGDKAVSFALKEKKKPNRRERKMCGRWIRMVAATHGRINGCDEARTMATFNNFLSFFFGLNFFSFWERGFRFSTVFVITTIKFYSGDLFQEENIFTSIIILRKM